MKEDAGKRQETTAAPGYCNSPKRKTRWFPLHIGKRRPFCFARDPQNRRQTTTYRLYPFRRQAMRSLAVEHRAGCLCLP